MIIKENVVYLAWIMHPVPVINMSGRGSIVANIKSGTFPCLKMHECKQFLSKKFSNLILCYRYMEKSAINPRMQNI